MNIIDAFYKEFPNIQIRTRKQPFRESCLVDIFDASDGKWMLFRTATSFEEAIIQCFEGMANLRRGLSEKEVDDMKQRFINAIKEQ